MNAAIPKRGSDGAAGYDLSSAVDVTIPTHGRGIVKTGLALKVPKGTYARIVPRSGLSVKKSIDIGAGVVDEDYRVEVGVVLINHGDQDFPVKQGGRIAQLILEKIKTPSIKEVQFLDETKRGESGFGSTGTKVDSMEKNFQMSEIISKAMNELKRLSGSNQPHILHKSEASKHRCILSIKRVKNLARKNVPMFLAIVRKNKETP